MSCEEQLQAPINASNNKKRKCFRDSFILYIIILCVILYVALKSCGPGCQSTATETEIVMTFEVEDTPLLGPDETPSPPNGEPTHPPVEEPTYLPTADPTKISDFHTPTAVPTNVKTRISDSNFFRVDNDYFEFNFAGSRSDPQIKYFAAAEEDCYYLPENSLTNGLIEFEFNDEQNTIIERPNNNDPLKCSISYKNSKSNLLPDIQRMIFLVEIQPLEFDGKLLDTDLSPDFILSFNCLDVNAVHKVTFHLSREKAYYRTIDYPHTYIGDPYTGIEKDDHILLVLIIDFRINEINLQDVFLYKEINEQTFLIENPDNLVVPIIEKISYALSAHQSEIDHNNQLNCVANKDNLELQFGVIGVREKGVKVKVYTFIIESKNSLDKDYFNFHYPEPLLPSVSID